MDTTNNLRESWLTIEEITYWLNMKDKLKKIPRRRQIEMFAKECWACEKSLRNAGHYYLWIKRIGEQNPELAEKILKWKVRIKKKDIRAIGQCKNRQQSWHSYL